MVGRIDFIRHVVLFVHINVEACVQYYFDAVAATQGIFGLE